MSEITDVSDKIMRQISSGALKMRPKWWFVAGSILAIGGLAVTLVVFVFSFSLGRFLLRTHGPMGSYRLDQLLQTMPWWLIPLAVVSLIGGILLLRRYDFAYRKNFVAIALGVIASLILAGWLVDATGLDAWWLNRGPMKQVVSPYMQQGGMRNNGAGGNGFNQGGRYGRGR